MLPKNWVGKTIGGRYQIEALLGQGGMSAVYRATDPNLRRMVAIKLIHPHLSVDPNFINRFKEEAAAVARLRHPNIVQVHDFNIDGETYYMVMEYLVGETLQARLKRLNAAQRYIPYPEVIQICSQMCEAVGYAHKHDLIHRDIKPANIMLDLNGQAILMDFGIVKIIGGEYHTATGATIGTALYMSPEQMRGERADERSDVYSLGVTLYEMLSGRPPYQADSTITLAMMVLNDPLPDLRKIREGIPEGLATTAEKSLTKDGKGRFQSMDEMLAELQRVEDQAVSIADVDAVVDEGYMEEVSPPEWTATMSMEAKDTSPEADLAPNEQDTEVMPSGLEDDDLVFGTPKMEDQPREALPTPGQVGEPTRRKTRRYGILAVVLLLIGVIAAGGYIYFIYQGAPDLQLAAIDQPLTAINAQNAQFVVNLGTWETNSNIEDLAFSPDGKILGTANNRNWMFINKYRYYNGLWRVDTGSLQDYLLGHTQWVNGTAFSPDGRLFASTSDDGSVILWNVSDGSQVQKFEGSIGSISSVDISPNNLLLAAGSSDGSVGMWQLDSDQLLRTLQGHEDSVTDVQFSSDGRLLASAAEDHTVRLWQVNDGGLLHTLRGHSAPVNGLAFSPDGSLVASASSDYTIGLWRVNNGSQVGILPGHSEAVLDVAFSPDGSLLASSSGDGTLRLWRVSDGEMVSLLTGHEASINSIVFSPDGHLLVSGASDGELRFWGLSEAISPETEEP
jgi:serine/threonine protein kinase/WD40 repeat protein